MSRKKSQKIRDVVNFQNVFSPGNDNIENSLRSFFGNKEPFTLEIGCGHGDYTVEMAKLYPQRNFIGIDYKGARVYNGAINAIENKLRNAAFIVCGAEKLEEIFSANSVEEIILPFPDPHKSRSSFKRLVDKNFLNIYKNIARKNARGHIKTDNEELYLFTLEVLRKEKYSLYFYTPDLYCKENLDKQLLIQTRYEKQYLSEGKKIKYICFGWDK